MKTRRLTVMTVASIALFSGTTIVAQTAAGAPIAHKVVTRVDQSPAPTALDPVAAAARDGAITENVLTVAERILIPDNPMLKFVRVQPVGVKGFSAWQLASDEGGADHEQTAPNPLTYMTTGIAANLYTSLQRAVEVMDLSVQDMSVEVKVFYRYDAPFTPDWAGYTDKVIANILIESDESPDVLADLKEMALNAWVAGEGLANDTEIDVALAVNGSHWDDVGALPGSVPDPVSVDNGLTLSRKTQPPIPMSFELGEDIGMESLKQFPDVFEFAVIAIVDSADDAERPYLQRISTRALQEGYVGWELFADDSYGVDGMDKAPSSLDYLTAGTSLCLMSQLTGVPMSMQLDVPDFRVEHLFSYRQDGFMTTDMAGFTDGVQTRVVVNSAEAPESLEEYFNRSLRACFAGEAFDNETPIETDLYVNGAIVE